MLSMLGPALSGDKYGRLETHLGEKDLIFVHPRKVFLERTYIFNYLTAQ